MEDLILIRGLPGSGKSTLAKEMIDGVQSLKLKHLETDAYFMKEGVYQFNPTKLKLAHLWCQDQTRMYLRDGYKVIVSNTFTQVWEMQPYLDMGKELGKTVRVLTAIGQYQNVHGVPQEALDRMKARWEEYVA